MTPDDVDAATEALIRGDWGDRREWWRFVVTNPGCIPLVAEDDGGIVATGVGTVHGSVGWVGTIYTVPERRRQGLGLAISEAVCDALTAAGCRTQVLVATPEGRGVYEKLGFEEATAYRVFGRDGTGPTATGEGRGVDDGAPAVRDLNAADVEAVLALDRAATGEDRERTLRACFESDTGLVVRHADGRLGGFLVHAPWHGAAVIAPDPDDALALLHARLVRAGPGHPVRAGILEGNEAGRRVLEADGWTELRRIVRMQRGEPLHWRPTSIWGQLGFAIG
jgi:GNAT superfamily N-acetyltransferase